MDLLKITENQEGMFLKNGAWVSIRDIEKDDLLALIRGVAENDDVCLDECNSNNPINDPIAKTIYEQIYRVLHDLDEHRSTYLAEIDEEFDALEIRYDLKNAGETLEEHE